MKTTIVIPNYNGAHFLEKCLPTLRKQSAEDAKSVADSKKEVAKEAEENIIEPNA